MNPDQIWLEFLQELMKDVFPTKKIRPYQDALLETLCLVIKNLRPHLLRVDGEKTQPTCVLSDDRIHYILSFGPDTSDFCFSFLIENETWYLEHIETIFIRFDQMGLPPISVFPDLPENTKAWCRDEWRVTEMVRLYLYLIKEKGKEFALNWFCDGEEYSLGVRAWAPFLPLSNAFIFFLCWEWANLENNQVTLEYLDEMKAVIRARLRFFELYERAGHLHQQICRADFYELFETIWFDRSIHAGWHLRISHESECSIFTFSKEILSGS